MDDNFVIMVGGIVFSLLFSYFPGLSTWYDPLTPTKKRLIMLGVLVLSTAGIFTYSCFGPIQYMACNAEGAWLAFEMFIVAAIANQTTYALSPR